MKKLILFLCFVAMGFTQVNAQGGDPAAREARLKEMKAELVTKAKITEAEADKVMEINAGNREKMRGWRDLSEEDRKKLIDEITAENTKKYKAIPLSDEQVKAVNAFFEERRKNMQRGN